MRHAGMRLAQVGSFVSRGMDGYVKIARGPKGRDCGVTTSTAYAVYQ